MIREINIDEYIDWNMEVCTFPDYDVFYLADYCKAFMNETPENGIPILLIYENGKDRAINVIFRRDVALAKNIAGKLNTGLHYDLISPYGYGGFFGNVTDWDKLEEEYIRYCTEKHYVCEFVRFELFSDYYCHYGGEVESRTHNIIRSLDISIDEIWMDFKQKVRKNVKKAKKNGLKIIIENEGIYLSDFLRIYYGTMERASAENAFFYSKSFFEIINRMKDNVCYFHVVHHDEKSGEDKIISTELVIYGSKNAYSFLGGTDRNYFEVRPNDYLKWEIINWAKKKGIQNFVLGGGYGADDGIFEYKRCLAPNGIVNYYIGKRIFCQKIYDDLLSLGNNPENSLFFPAYRE